MIKAGAPEEAAALADIDPDLPAAKILGLRELSAMRSGVLEPAAAIAEAQVATRQYAKRQVTWFRHEPRMIPLNGFGADPAVLTEARALITRLLDLG